MTTPLLGKLDITEALQSLAKSQSSLNERVLYEAADAADMEDTSASKQDYLARKAKADRNHNLVKEMLKQLTRLANLPRVGDE